ncbi:MAG: response regulator [Clostridiales bacterium]|jgi:signal transduction histidine kinase/CheY-like chemotaxis protein/methyl-accepting chemotaxis protein|nr:response regulator [Clostridiales bacterium]
MSIKAKLIIPTTAIFILAAAATLLINIYLFHAYIHNSTVEKVESASAAALKNIESGKEEALSASLSLSREPFIREALVSKDRESLLKVLSPLFNEYSPEFCTVTDAEGAVIASTHASEETAGLPLPPDIRSALSGKAYSAVAEGSAIRLSIRAGTPVYDDRGALIGVISVGIRMDTDSFADSIKELVNCEATLILGSERVSTTVLRDDGARATGTRIDAEIAKTVLAGTPYAGRVNVLGRAAICRYTPVEGADGTVIGMLFIGQYVEEAYKVTQSFVLGGAVITVVMLEVSVLVILLIVGRIVDPIQDMTRAASALAMGDTDLDISVKTDDEMKTLADAFNSMVSNTRQQIEIVKHIASGDLETSILPQSPIEVTENIASGALGASILPRSDKDEMNRALEKLNVTIREQKAALREEHRRAQLMLDTNPLACRLWDKNINLIDCNDAAVKLFNLKDKQEYIDRYFELTPEYQPDGRQSRAKIKAMVREAFKLGACQFEFTYQMLDGTPLPTDVSLVRVPYGDGFVVAAYSRDLREHIKMMSEIAQRDKITQTINQIADIMLRSGPEVFNDTLYKCMGMMARAIDADRMYIFKNHTENEKLYCTQIYEWSENAKPFQNTALTVNLYYDENAPETRKILQRGEYFHTLIRDMPASDRAQYEVQGILAIMLIPVFIHNEFWGFVGFDNCHSEQLFTENDESVVRSGSILIANALLRNEYVKSIHDASAELETALAAAETANSAKGDFLASMSHEMRTPLNAIIGLSEIALDDVSLSEDSVSNLEKIHNSGSTLLSIVNDILDVSKIQSGKFEITPNVYDVPSMINDAVIQNVLRIGSRPIRFVLNIGGDMPASLLGDDLRIRQIISNLLSNAIKYTEEGCVELSFSHERDGDFVWLSIRVKDTGIGIKPEQLEHLFADFVQFGTSQKHKAGGTGLGLSITKSLTEMMDGTVSVESVYGEGSVFTARLRQRFVNEKVIGPEVAKNIGGLQYSPGKLNRGGNKRQIQLPYARVLLVDDNITNLDVAKGLMRPYGMRIDCVTGGLDAVNAVRDEKVKYNAIFMDHMMPETDGVEATRIIREEIGTDYARSVPIIALTANAVAGSEEMFFRKGFQAFISKPIDINKLDSVINRWVRDKNLEEKYANAYRDSGQADAKDSLWKGISVRGMDIAGALERFSGEDEILNIILHSYASSTRSLLKDLDEYLSSEKYKDYTIGVHGIKGTSFSVFAEEAGKAAEELEALSKTEDRDALKLKHAAFKAMTETLLDDLDKAIEKIDAAVNDAAFVPCGKSGFDFTAPDANILIVDDNETNLKVALGLLKPLQMRIDTAENGQRALRMIHKTPYHLIFMDYFMPVMDGVEATIKLRRTEGEYYQHVPVIALSAGDVSDTKDIFIEAGMNDFVTKPIDRQEIGEKIKHWLPKELIKAPEAGVPEAAVPEAAASEAPTDDLPVIEGINAAEGVRYSGSRELFITLLGDFYKLIDIKAQKIEKCLADGMLRDVTIEAHALKNTARMLGAEALSTEFALLERYGKAEDADALARETGAVLEHYRSYKPLLKPYGEAAEKEKQPATAEELVSLLRLLQSAVNGFNLDIADDALKQLDKLRMPAECQARMDDLRAYAADVAMEEVLSLTEEIIGIINRRVG